MFVAKIKKYLKEIKKTIFFLLIIFLIVSFTLHNKYKMPANTPYTL